MLTIVSDLLLTDAFLIKGTVEDKYTRLSQVLDEHRKFFLKVRDATLIDLKTHERIQTPLLHVNVDEILLAHELLDESGDQYLRALSHDEELHKVRAFYTGEQNLEVSGLVRPGCYEATDRATRRFFVVREPELRGLKTEGDEDLGLLDGLSYAILNKPRLSYLYDFN